MDGVSVADLLQSFGSGGLFIGYLLYQNKLDREEREKRRKSDVKLALALDRFVTRMTGQPLNLSEGVEDEQV